MSAPISMPRSRASTISDEECQARVELAACYRIFDHLGWVELIFNHITLKVPGTRDHFLINPYGLWYSEVTASNLVKIDLDGNIVGESDWPVNPAGFVIHSAIHANRADAKCVMHTHTTSGIAVACMEDGLSRDNFYGSIVGDDIAYHDFEGVTCDDDEKPRLVASIGSKNHIILRNHGLLTMGDSVATAFIRLWRLQRACDVQLAAQQSGQKLIALGQDIVERSGDATQNFEGNKARMEDRVYEALVRKIDQIDPSYRN
ncbi:MAG: class II aldolase/adducin family protein [Minwuia sp.]|uniref:class II aldolase/adducin family protein n=1 Tax=Minwuia sp. TaxID=2493630 RepID=UPI003A8B90D2